MTGRFSDLKPSSEGRQKLWENNSNHIRELLEEINNDVFEGKGTFEKGVYGGAYRQYPPLVEPYCFLKISYTKSIAVCSASTMQLRVIAEASERGWRTWNCFPGSLLSILRVAVTFVVN